MADNRSYYVICADGCKFESMTKEQILTAIAQAVSTGEIKDVDTGFVTKIKEKNKGAGLSFWVGTSAEYNAITEKDNNCFYILTDDVIGNDFENRLEENAAEIESLKEYIEKTLPEKFTNINMRIDVLYKTVVDEHNRKEAVLWEGNFAGTYTDMEEPYNEDNFIVNGEIETYSLVRVENENGECAVCTVQKTDDTTLIIKGMCPDNTAFLGGTIDASVFGYRLEHITLHNKAADDADAKWVIFLNASRRYFYESTEETLNTIPITKIVGLM